MRFERRGGSFTLFKHKEKYLVILFDEGSNFIHAEAITDLSGNQLASATERGLAFFSAHGSENKTFRLDNQISNTVRNVLTKANITIHLTPVGQHRRNKAERAIRTFKNHFINSECPLELWPDFIEQIEFTLNLMRPMVNTMWTSRSERNSNSSNRG